MSEQNFGFIISEQALLAGRIKPFYEQNLSKPGFHSCDEPFTGEI